MIKNFISSLKAHLSLSNPRLPYAVFSLSLWFIFFLILLSILLGSVTSLM